MAQIPSLKLTATPKPWRIPMVRWNLLSGWSIFRGYDLFRERSDWIPKHLFEKDASKNNTKTGKTKPSVSIPKKKDSGKHQHCLDILKKNRFCLISFSGEVGFLVATILPEISLYGWTLHKAWLSLVVLEKEEESRQSEFLGKIHEDLVLPKQCNSR